MSVHLVCNIAKGDHYWPIGTPIKDLPDEIRAGLDPIHVDGPLPAFKKTKAKAEPEPTVEPEPELVVELDDDEAPF